MAVEVKGIRIRALWIVIAIAIIEFFLLGLIFLITRILIRPPASWWWTGGLFIIEFVLDIISGVIYLIYRLAKEPKLEVRQEVKDLKPKVIKEIQYDEENPDNFMILKQRIRFEGDPSRPRTQLVHFKGYGTESGERIDVIVNMMSSKFEMSRLDGSTDPEVEETIRTMAENPERQVVSKTSMSWDQFGRAVQTTETKSSGSISEKEQQEQQKEADVAGAY